MEKVNYREILNYFISKWLIVVISIASLVVFGTFYSTVLKTPKYESNSSLVLVSETTNNYNENDLLFNQKLVSTYSEIITSRKVLSQVIDNLGLDYKYKELYKMVDVTTKTNTELIRITVTSKDSKEAYNITKEIVKVFSKDVKEIYKISNITVLDKAIYSTKPCNKNLIKDEIVYVGCGIVMGLVTVFAVFYLDTTVKSKEEIEGKFGINVVGNVPIVKDIEIEKSNPRSYFNESVRLIKTNVNFSCVDSKVKTILVTSPCANDGKSFIALNLATSYAQSGKKVLLVEADLREGELAKSLDVKNTKGYSKLILEYESSDTSIRTYIKKTSIENLSIITKGITPPNPAELLSSEKNKKVIDRLRKSFDLIIIDCPPVLGLSDTLITAKYSDYNILVVSSHKTKEKEVKETINLFNQCNSKINGIVINKIKDNKLNSKNYYSGYYMEN